MDAGDADHPTTNATRSREARPPNAHLLLAQYAYREDECEEHRKEADQDEQGLPATRSNAYQDGANGAPKIQRDPHSPVRTYIVSYGGGHR